MKISVVIVTRNRKEDLIQTLTNFQKQTYPDKEIIVIDNCSTDGTKEEIPKLFPNVYYEWIPENFDIRSIILGVYKSTGDIIWRTDSDSHPESPQTFEKVVEIFQKHPEIDIIATEIVDANRGHDVYDWYKIKVDKVNIPDGGYPSPGFLGGGAAIRRRVFDTIGGFNGFGFEEFEFSARAIIAGFNIRYFPNIRTIHYASTRERFKKARWLDTTREFTRYSWKFFPFLFAFGRTCVIFFFQIIEGILRRVGILILLEGILLIPYTALRTIRTERCVAPKDKRKILTISGPLLFNYIKDFAYYFKVRIRKLFKKIKKDAG